MTIFGMIGHFIGWAFLNTYQHADGICRQHVCFNRTFVLQGSQIIH